MNLKIRATALLICICMVITLLSGCGLEELIPDFMLPDKSDSYAEIQDTVIVSVLDGEHYRITSANPVRVGIGATATFTVEIDEGYEYLSNSIGAQYADGKITIADVKRHVSLEIATKKQDIIITHTHAGGTETCTSGAVCDECGKEYTDPLGHSISDVLFDENGHWYECERDGCDYTEGAAQHSGGTATCTAPAVCEVCGHGYGAMANHRWQTELSYDESNHWYACDNPDCTAQNVLTSHYGGEATYTEQAVCEGCGAPYGELKHQHSGGKATCNEPAICESCGQSYGAALGHKWSETYSYDDNLHWYVCTNDGCDEINGRTSHYGGEATYDEKAVCEGCGAHYGNFQHRHIGGTATCDDPAVCEDCGLPYGNALGHKWSETPTYNDNQHWYVCTNDGCDKQNGLADHYGGEATYDEKAVCEGCGAHYGELKHRHVGGAATCTSPAVCDDCGSPYGTSLGHAWSETYVCDNFSHWHTCTRGGCNETTVHEEHYGGTATYYDYAICEACSTPYGELVPKPEFETVTLKAAEPEEGYRFLCWTASIPAEEGGLVFGETASGTFQIPFEATPVANYVDVNHHVILYRTNGGTTSDGYSFYYQTFSNEHYQMPNTIHQNGTFVRDGYVLMMYTENADGSGEYTTLGGKIVPNDNGFIELYCQWGEVTEKGLSYYIYTRDDGGLSACVQSYTGSDEQVVIPATAEIYYNGSSERFVVDKIAAGAFKNVPMTSLVIPHTVMTIEDGAFEGCSNLVELTIHDNFTSVKDAAFGGAPISTVYFNSARLPGHGENMFCLKYEKLRMTYVQGKNTIVVMSGSSSLYGFYAKQMQEAFYGEYEVVNYGTNAGSNSLFYMNAFVRFMDEGDIMLNAPEIGGNDAQMAIPSLTRWTIRAIERMYEIVSYVDMTEFTSFFDAVSDHNANRGKDQSYEYWSGSLVDEYTDYTGNFDNFNYSGTAKYNPCNIGKLTQAKADRLNLLNERITENGALLYMSFAPVNIQECVDSAKDPANQAAFRAHCEAMLDYPVISDPGTYIMEQKYFSNAGYHPGKTGAQIRTTNLTADLKAQMIIDGLWYEE